MSASDVYMHSDAGRLLRAEPTREAQAEREELPPRYDPDWRDDQ